MMNFLNGVNNMTHYVQLKQGIIDELQEGFERHPQLNAVAVHGYGVSNMYTRDMLYAGMFVVEYDDRNDAFRIIKPDCIRNHYLSKSHVELYYNPLQLEDEVFEWEE